MSSFVHAYQIFNAAMPTTAAPPPVTTNTAIRTMLQLAPTRLIEIIGWGYTINDVPGGDSTFELITTGTIAATVTAHAASGIIKLGNPASDNSQVTLGVAATGYSASAEGAIVASRLLDAVVMNNSEASAAAKFAHQQYFLPGEMQVPAGDILRVRATTPITAVDMLCWIKWLE